MLRFTLEDLIGGFKVIKNPIPYWLTLFFAVPTKLFFKLFPYAFIFAQDVYFIVSLIFWNNVKEIHRDNYDDVGFTLAWSKQYKCMKILVYYCFGCNKNLERFHNKFFTSVLQHVFNYYLVLNFLEHQSVFCSTF